MSKPDEFPKPQGADNTKEGMAARKAKLLQEQRERRLSEIFEKFHLLEQERFRLELYRTREWESFLQTLGEVINSLLSIDVFTDNKELEKECREVLLLIGNNDTSQLKKYYDLVGKISTFFFERVTYIQPKLPD